MQNLDVRTRVSRWAAPRRWVLLSAFCVLGPLLAGGCAKTRLATVPDGPPLAVPAPPSRILAPVEEPLAENAPPAEPTATPPATNASPARPTTPRRPTTTVTTPAEEPKTETPASVQAPPTTEPPVLSRPTPPDANAERRVRDVLRKATVDLNRVDYQRLSANGKAQYEQAKRFVEQSEAELKDRNYALATTVADKAAALATELLGAR